MTLSGSTLPVYKPLDIPGISLKKRKNTKLEFYFCLFMDQVFTVYQHTFLAPLIVLVDSQVIVCNREVAMDKERLAQILWGVYSSMVQMLLSESKQILSCTCYFCLFLAAILIKTSLEYL